jgi:hypothetical protein
MKPTNHPQVKLKGIEYLLLAIQSDPGKSQRHYLRRLYQYKHGVPSYNNGGTNNGYFTSDSYRNVLWYDDARGAQVRYGCSDSVNSVFLNTSDGNRYPHYGYAYKSKCSVMKLTLSGHERANKVRETLGLDPINLLDGAPAHANWV